MFISSIVHSLPDSCFDKARDKDKVKENRETALKVALVIDNLLAAAAAVFALLSIFGVMPIRADLTYALVGFAALGLLSCIPADIQRIGQAATRCIFG